MAYRGLEISNQTDYFQKKHIFAMVYLYRYCSWGTMSFSGIPKIELEFVTVKLAETKRKLNKIG